ncbi:hypothetical protein [Dictyobacter aurantiacus]|uniref:Uncharacterized protein n=1 Tax=Dictyobacter aurantiacus TaxID=1936993 RepID=A0A401ZP48_9CHLR|nr:hypothetical protein [Dictyobacter aurantiacus]GCE08526.1 hypothetical protein KDAU_58550 [Dictyobacter aurantiacus]
MVEKRSSRQRQEQQQQLLFARQQTTYTWRNVRSVARDNVIIIMQQEVRVLGVRQDSDDVFVSYTDPSTGTKTEQLFNLTDYVYLKL